RQKISITSRKPQTTRHRILGIHSTADTQFIFVDTPGLHQDRKKPLNRMMNDTVHKVIRDVDVILFVTERLIWNDQDEAVLKAVSGTRVPVLLIINKIDQISEKPLLLPHMEKLAGKFDFTGIIPVSALKDENLEIIDNTVKKYLPTGQFLFPQDMVTDRSSRFVAAELIREKITRQLGDELPYEVTVEIEKFSTAGPSVHIHALILVEKQGQKQILIGKDGERLKSIGSDARLDMEKMFQRKVMLKLWVKVKSGWGDSDRALQSLGYADF
ncbi:MAG: GTPase Era, partial [Pseudohongiellaceae bacterium]